MSSRHNANMMQLATPLTPPTAAAMRESGLAPLMPDPLPPIGLTPLSRPTPEDISQLTDPDRDPRLLGSFRDHVPFREDGVVRQESTDGFHQPPPRGFGSQAALPHPLRSNSPLMRPAFGADMRSQSPFGSRTSFQDPAYQNPGVMRQASFPESGYHNPSVMRQTSAQSDLMSVENLRASGLAPLMPDPLPPIGLEPFSPSRGVPQFDAPHWIDQWRDQMRQAQELQHQQVGGGPPDYLAPEEYAVQEPGYPQGAFPQPQAAYRQPSPLGYRQPSPPPGYRQPSPVGYRQPSPPPGPRVLSPSWTAPQTAQLRAQSPRAQSPRAQSPRARSPEPWGHPGAQPRALSPHPAERMPEERDYVPVARRGLLSAAREYAGGGRFVARPKPRPNFDRARNPPPMNRTPSERKFGRPEWK